MKLDDLKRSVIGLDFSHFRDIMESGKLSSVGGPM